MERYVDRDSMLKMKSFFSCFIHIDLFIHLFIYLLSLLLRLILRLYTWSGRLLERSWKNEFKSKRFADDWYFYIEKAFNYVLAFNKLGELQFLQSFNYTYKCTYIILINFTQVFQAVLYKYSKHMKPDIKNKNLFIKWNGSIFSSLTKGSNLTDL